MPHDLETYKFASDIYDFDPGDQVTAKILHFDLSAQLQPQDPLRSEDASGDTKMSWCWISLSWTIASQGIPRVRLQVPGKGDIGSTTMHSCEQIERQSIVACLPPLMGDLRA